MSESLNMTAPPAAYRKRRAQLAADLPRPMVILCGQPGARQYATNTYPLRCGSSYLYFGGPPLSGAAWLIEPGSDGENGCTLLRPNIGFDDAVWTGAPPTDDVIAAAAGVPTRGLASPDGLRTRLSGASASFVGPPCPVSTEWMTSLGLEPAEPDELQPIIDLRLIKDQHELGAMRRAAEFGIEAHLAAMKATSPGKTEAEVVAALTAALIARQCMPSFTPIVTVHGEILHCDQYPHMLEAGQLLVIDAGAEEPGGYASDITRTYPTSGKFTPMQRQLYDIVLRAEREAIAACVPGRRYRDVHDLSAHVICEGLVEAELLRGDPEQLAARRVHTLFFPHGVGHLLGLDVHDMEDFGDQAGYAPGRQRRSGFGDKFLRMDRDLAAGMTLTVEPGIYIVPAVWQNDELLAPFEDAVNRRAVEALIKKNFGGIRIEDNVHVRAEDQGPEILTAALPTDADQVAALVAGR